jgi:hypothetical protein
MWRSDSLLEALRALDECEKSISAADLVNMMGGENLEHEIADFPTLDKRMLRLGTTIEIYRLSEGESFFAPPSEDTR